ncbi:MAG: ferredoxin, partial [Firmicutes bacterium]|nr:ferredoxin [Bacillota bacterium]
MSERRVWCMFFSATGGVKKIATQLTRAMCEKLECDRRTLDISTPAGREKPPVFAADDIVVCALPVYAGRVPNVLLPYLRTIQGNGAKACAVVVYGNRAYDNALRELQGLLEEGGCT